MPIISQTPRAANRPEVGLFVTCLADMIRPRVGFAAMRLLRQAGCNVVVPRAQTCCGQPAFNSGDSGHARQLAKNVIKTFEKFDYVVVPSGSCAGMIKLHYRQAFADDPAWKARAENLATRTYELLSFLVDVRSFRPEGVSLHASATYHDTCSGLRELGVEVQPRLMLQAVEGLHLTPLPGHDVCCGFGGTFCVKYSSISNAIVDEKARDIEATGADLLLGGDLGCLMNMAGKLHRRGARTRVFHAAEVIAGMADGPAIGEEA
ncbi:MAG TPA: (Fe-S)-binding protein [Beijerinckia sp.]|jgi:L-lactate dehydrogenase complex protein LldE|nr:(Fe-S)-binding protein [Beijerinckia sp.]